MSEWGGREGREGERESVCACMRVYKGRGDCVREKGRETEREK